jgi:hypothetical protein
MTARTIGAIDIVTAVGLGAATGQVVTYNGTTPVWATPPAAAAVAAETARATGIEAVNATAIAAEATTARAAETAAAGLAIASGSVSGTTLTLTRTNAGTVAITGLPSGGASATPVTTVATSGASQAIAFPVSGNAAFDITQTANCAITLTGGTEGQLQTVTLILRQNVTAGWSAALPAGVKWSGGVAPAVNTLAGKIDVFTLSTPDAGATVFGAY